MDEKGRIKMPAVLRKQFAATEESKFVLVKDLEDCLVIYTMKSWNELEAKLRKLNSFNLDHQRFINLVTTGWTEVEIDKADRFLISTSLKKYLGNGKQILLKGKFDKIQVWDAAKYAENAQVNHANSEFLAKEVANYLDGLEEGKK
jgi:MraZ protein